MQPLQTIRLAWRLLLAVQAVLLVAWFTMPCTPMALDRPDYIQETLRSGSRLITVRQDVNTGWDAAPSEMGDYRPLNWGKYENLIFNWQLKQQSPTENMTLRIGHPRNRGPPHFDIDLDLTALAASNPRFVRERLLLWAPAGETEDQVLLSLFPDADATLFYHQTRSSWRCICLRVLISEPGTIQIWKDMPRWDLVEPSDIQALDDEDRDAGLIASFALPSASDTSMPTIKMVRVSMHDAMVPSRTYPVRQRMLIFIAPALFILELVSYSFSAVIDLVPDYTILFLTRLVPLYVLIVLLSWMLFGRGATFALFTRRFWMTRFVARKIFGPPRPPTWGLTGPLDEEHEKVVRKSPTAAKPLSGIGDFFQSSRPLDDLLMTFRCTRWMLQPLWGASRANTPNRPSLHRNSKKKSPMLEPC